MPNPIQKSLSIQKFNRVYLARTRLEQEEISDSFNKKNIWFRKWVLNKKVEANKNIQQLLKDIHD